MSQDHPDKRQIVLNTLPAQTLVGDFPNVRIINLPERPISLAACRNIAVREAEPGIICVLDDDDLALPHYLSTIAKHFGDGDWMWMDKLFYLEKDRIKSIAQGTANVFAFTRDAWEKIGGYSEAFSVGEDRNFISRMTSALPGKKATLEDSEIAYFYRWGQSAIDHISGRGDDRAGRTPAWERSGKLLDQKIKARAIPSGHIELKPQAKHDYGEMARRFIQTTKPKLLADRNTPPTLPTIIVRPIHGRPAIYHVVERHHERNAQALARKQRAWDSWDVLYLNGVVPCHHWHYARSAKDIGDALLLPYLKDVLQPALAIAADDDIVIWTNDDTVLHPALPDCLRQHMIQHPVVTAQRCEFRLLRVPPPSAAPQEWAKASLRPPHPGRDLFAATGSWLRAKWDAIPDFILGAPHFDWWMAAMVRKFYGLTEWRKTIVDAIAPAELPRGYVGHVLHQADWMRPHRKSAAADHNTALFERWKTEHPDMPAAVHLAPLPDSTLHLSNVTLWACVWSKSNNAALLERTLRVLNYCQRIIRFQRVLFFSYLDCAAPAGVEIVKIPELATISDWNEFVNRIVPRHIQSDYAMSVHEDGFPIQPQLWIDDFLAYDYIGAPWADGVVGNGGFNIESKRLLDLKLALPATDVRSTASDYWVCRNHRVEFESAGIRFAPKHVAEKFSTESYGQNRPSFGFHGRTLSPAKYAAGWSLIETSEAENMPNSHPSITPRMQGKICITTTFDRNYTLAGQTMMKSVRRYTDCAGIDFKVITADPEVVAQFGAENCHIVTDEIKARYKNVKYSKELPESQYAASWYRYELFNLKGYDRVICIDSDCLCLQDISYLFSEELNQFDLVSVEDHIVSKCFTKYVPQLEAQGLNFRGLKQRMQQGKIDVQPALLVANKRIVNEEWYRRLVDYANTAGFTYSIDEGILNDFIYMDNLRIKLLPLEWDYQDCYEIHCPGLPVLSNPVIVHCQESKPFKKNKMAIDARMHKWHDRWWSESRFKDAQTIVAVIVWNRFENLKRWINCWKQCDKQGAELVVIHNQESNNLRYRDLCQANDVKYVPRQNIGFDLGAFQDVCIERLVEFPNNWKNLIWITDDCIPMQKDFVAKYMAKLLAGYIPCYEISNEVKRHVRTTGFLVTKELSKRLIFPRDPMTEREDCYVFEHKGFNMYEQMKQLGLEPHMVSTVLKDSPLWDTGCRAGLKLMPRHKLEFSGTPDHSTTSPTVAPVGVLDNLAIKHKADKSSLYHNFAAKYDRLLSSVRESFTNVLEIGVAQGQSLKMWADYFPKAIIHGADNSVASRACESYSNRIKFHLTNQGNEAQLKNLEQFSPFDLIVDDGNHFWREQILSFNTLFPFVRSGGVYIVEDSCTSYWSEYKNNPISCADYFKGLVDEVNLKGARGRVPVNPPPDFSDWHNGWHRREDCHKLPAFESIHFMNALIVIFKR